MSKESLYNYNDWLLHSPLLSEQRCKGKPTDVYFSNGIATLNGSSSIIIYDPVYGVRSVRIILELSTTTEDIIKLSATHSIEVSGGTITATGWNSPTIYVDGVPTATITTAKSEIIITTATAFNADDIQLGFISSYLDAEVEIMGFNKTELSLEEVELLFDKALYKEPNFNSGGLTEILSINPLLGTIADEYKNPITNTNVITVPSGGYRAEKYDGSTSKLVLGNLGTVKGIMFWMHYDGTDQSILTLDGGTTNLTISSDVVSSLGDDVFIDNENTNAITIGWHLITVISSAGLTASNFIFGNAGANYFPSWMGVKKLNTGVYTLKIATNYWAATKLKYGL